MKALHRVLELVRRELGASDARLELGGRVPESDHLVWIELDHGWRLVTVFNEPPHDPEDSRNRLRTLADSFASTFDDASQTAPKLGEPDLGVAARLTEVLDLLVERASASGAVVVDVDSPVVWGHSAGARWTDDAEALATLGDLAEALPGQRDWPPILRGEVTALPDRPGPPVSEGARRRLAKLEPALADRELVASRLVLAIAVAHARRTKQGSTVHGDEGGHVIRPFSSIYRLVLAFDRPFSVMHAEANASRALPLVERLVGELPPVDPTPTSRGARVMPFKRS